MNTVLAVRNLRVTSEQSELVRGISFSLEQGEVLTILGESGSGKSLLSRAIMGTLPRELAASGDVSIDGTTTKAGSDTRTKLWGRSIALLPQEPWLALDPTMRVIPQVAEGYLDSPFEARSRNARGGLEKMRLRDVERKYPFMLSGGMAQRVAFAATRAGGAKILIVDEPTKGLDAELRSQFIAILRAELKKGNALLTITHDIHVARELGGRIAIMLEGKFAEEGPAQAVLHRPQHEYSRRLIAAEPEAWPPRPTPVCGDIIVSGRDISKTFGTHTLFSGMDFDIRAGARVAITGPSGIGKTTLGNIILGLAKPDTGHVHRDGMAPAISFQKLYQDPPAAFAPRATLRQSLDDLVKLHDLRWNSVETLMFNLRLGAHLLDRHPAQISGGELQRFAMIRVLLLRPTLIFADEPTSRLDPITQQETIDLLVNHAAEQNAALLLVTHDPAIAMNVGDSNEIRLENTQHPGEHQLTVHGS